MVPPFFWQISYRLLHLISSFFLPVINDSVYRICIVSGKTNLLKMSCYARNLVKLYANWIASVVQQFPVNLASQQVNRMLRNISIPRRNRGKMNDISRF